MQKHVNLVDLVKSFPTIISLQKSASIQPRTSLSKFGGKFNSIFTRLLDRCRQRKRVRAIFRCSVARSQPRIQLRELITFGTRRVLNWARLSEPHLEWTEADFATKMQISLQESGSVSDSASDSASGPASSGSASGPALDQVFR